MKKQIIKNLFSNYLGTFISMLLGILIVPFLIFKLNKDAFGISILAESIISFFQVFTFSLRIALSRNATIAISKKDTPAFIEYLSTGKYILNIVAVFTLIGGLILSYFFPILFNIPDHLKFQSQILFALIIISFSASIPNIIYWSVLYAHQRFDLINYSNFGGMILRAVFIFFLFNILPAQYINLITYGIIYFIMTLGQNILVFIWHKKIHSSLKISSKITNKNKIKEVLAFTSQLLMGNIGTIISDVSINIIVNILLGPVFNTIYSISTKFPALIKRLFLDPTASLSPTFTHLVSIKDDVRLKMLFFMYSKLLNIMIFAVSVILIVYSKLIILTWVGGDFITSAELMPYFIVATALIIPSTICSTVNTSLGKVKFPALIVLSSSAITILLNLILIIKFNLGLKGIAVSSIIISLCVFSILIPKYTCSLLEIPLLEYCYETLFKPLFLAAILGFLTFYVSNQSHLLIFVTVSGLTAVYALLSYYICFTKNEKETLLTLIIKNKK